jgi:hypothetical protein
VDSVKVTVYILRALLDGIEEEEELFHVVMAKEKLNRAAVGFTLADFLLEYADFIQREGADPELID